VTELSSRKSADIIASSLDVADQAIWSTREDCDGICFDALLDLFEQVLEIWSTKMSGSLKSSEQAGVVNVIELLLGNVQHDGSEVELPVQFGDEDVNFQFLVDVFVFGFLDDIHNPFELFLGLANPKEDQLLHWEVDVILGTIDKVLQNGTIWCDTNSSSNKDNILVRGPHIAERTEWTIDQDWWIFFELRIVDFVEFNGPRPNGSNVSTKILLVRSRSDGEWMESDTRNGCGSNVERLSCFEIEFLRSFEFQM